MNYGHIRDDGFVQTLEDHLKGTAELAESFTSSIGLEDVGKVVGLIHDLGKASVEFRDYIIGVSNSKRGDVDHSTAGAQLIHARDVPLSKDNLALCVARQMMELAIISHHSGMIDCISPDGIDVFKKRIEKDLKKTHFDESIESLDQSIMCEVESRLPSAELSLSRMIEDLIQSSRDESVKDSGVLRLGLLSRFILSCLIDADRIDTSCFMDGSTIVHRETDWRELSHKLDDFLSSMVGTDVVSKTRARVSNACRDASGLGKGLFSLSVPTGGGKTLASLRFALSHAQNNGMARIIYVAPYTTIIEQNAAVVRRILESDTGQDLVLECHSSIDVHENVGGERYHWSGISDNWDAPVIFTTMVQFLEAIYGSGTKRIRRMHNIANSIIIFDEIQTVPIKTVYLFNEAVNFLIGTCGCSVVLCTATQPVLDRDLEFVLRNGTEIIEDVEGLSNDLRRTEISVFEDGRVLHIDEICDLVVNSINKSDSLLVVVHNIRMARVIHLRLRDRLDSVLAYHLSTDMCPVHRKNILNEMMRNIGSSKVLCVSTQLIEAGVDVDFNMVIRCMAGLDSIVQAAGRCNRNGKLDNRGKVLVVKTDEDLGKLPEILEGRRCTEQVIAEGYSDLLSTEAMSRYFELYFYRRRDHMWYDVGNSDTSLFDMLSKNVSAVRSYMSQNHNRPPEEVLRQSFSEANSIFNVIEQRDSIVIPYDDVARNAICTLSSDSNDSDRLRAIRVLQSYSVNTFMLSSMVSSGMAYEVSPGSGIFCLVDGYYDNEYGVMGGPISKAHIF